MNCHILISVLLGFMPFFAVAGGTTVSNLDTRLEANLGKGCHIAITLPSSVQGGIGGDPNYGSGGFEVNPLPKSWKFKSFQRLYFGLTCYDAEEAMSRTHDASFDPQTEIWTKDVDKRIRTLGSDISPQEYKILYADFDKAIRVFNLTAANSKGVASTEADTTGDEKNRRRQMGFCLFHPPKALCGGGVVGYIPDGPKAISAPGCWKFFAPLSFFQMLSDSATNGLSKFFPSGNGDWLTSLPLLRAGWPSAAESDFAV